MQLQSQRLQPASPFWPVSAFGLRDSHAAFVIWPCARLHGFVRCRIRQIQQNPTHSAQRLFRSPRRPMRRSRGHLWNGLCAQALRIRSRLPSKIRNSPISSRGAPRWSCQSASSSTRKPTSRASSCPQKQTQWRFGSKLRLSLRKSSAPRDPTPHLPSEQSIASHIIW